MGTEILEGGGGGGGVNSEAIYLTPNATLSPPQ